MTCILETGYPSWMQEEDEDEDLPDEGDEDYDRELWGDDDEDRAYEERRDRELFGD